MSKIFPFTETGYPPPPDLKPGTPPPPDLRPGTLPTWTWTWNPPHLDLEPPPPPGPGTPLPGPRTPPPPKCGQTENITFRHPSDAGGKNSAPNINGKKKKLSTEWMSYFQNSKWKADKSGVHAVTLGPLADQLISAGRTIKLWDLVKYEVLQVRSPSIVEQ